MLHDLKDKLDAAGYYEWKDVERFNERFFYGADHEELSGLIDVAVKPSYLRAALKHARHRTAVLSPKAWDPDDRPGPPVIGPPRAWPMASISSIKIIDGA